MTNQTERTGKQIATAVEKCCAEILTVISASNLLGKDYKFFDSKLFKTEGLEQFMKSKCTEYNLSVEHIKRILKDNK